MLIIHWVVSGRCMESNAMIFIKCYGDKWAFICVISSR